MIFRGLLQRFYHRFLLDQLKENKRNRSPSRNQDKRKDEQKKLSPSKDQGL